MADCDYSPSTVLVMLGSLHFEHEGSNDVLSVKISYPEERAENLEHAANGIKPSSVNNLHVILKSSSISSLYDDSVLSTFFNALKPGAEATVHVLGSADMPVQFGDCSEIRTSLVMTGLLLEEEGLTEGDEGGWTLTARKPGGDQDKEGEEEDGDE